MAAATVYSSLFDSNNQPTGGHPRSGIGRVSSATFSETIATTSLDDVGDRVKMIPIPEGAKIIGFFRSHADLDTNATETLDMDVVLSTTDSAGSVTDTILFNAGTAFEDAVTTPVWVAVTETEVPESESGWGSLDLKVNAVAATPAAANVTITAFWI